MVRIFSTDEDIVFPIGLRFRFIFNESLKIQKPYTNYQNGANNEITISYGTDLTNLEIKFATFKMDLEVDVDVDVDVEEEEVEKEKTLII
jgi:hypothetical protein